MGTLHISYIEQVPDQFSVEYDGKKEAFMVVFNTIIRRNLHAMRKYLDILASVYTIQLVTGGTFGDSDR